MTRDSHPSVLFISASGWLGGPGRSLLTLMTNLPPEIGQILVSPATGDLLPAIRERTPDVSHIRLFRGHGRIGHQLGRLVGIALLTAWIVGHRHRFAAIHANGFSELNLVALGALLSRVPVVAWFHGYEANPWDKRLGPIWARLLARRRLTAVSDLARQVVVETGLAPSHEIAIVPNPIDPRDVLASERAADMGRSGDRLFPVVGYLGSTISDKGFDLLPDIIDRARDAQVRWALFLPKPNASVAGDQQVWEKLEDLGNGGRVSFPGRRSDVRDAYRDCDIVICPSRRESFGRIAAEAMINGLPVVASDIGPLRDLVGEEGGILFPVGDASAAAAAVRKLAAEPLLRANLGQGAQLRATRFHPGPIVRRFTELYGLSPASNVTVPEGSRDDTKSDRHEAV